MHFHVYIRIHHVNAHRVFDKRNRVCILPMPQPAVFIVSVRHAGQLDTVQNAHCARNRNRTAAEQEQSKTLSVMLVRHAVQLDTVQMLTAQETSETQEQNRSRTRTEQEQNRSRTGVE